MSLPSSLIFCTLHSAWKNIVSANRVVGCCSVSMMDRAGPISKLPTDLLPSAMPGVPPVLLSDAEGLPQMWPLILQIVFDSFFFPTFFYTRMGDFRERFWLLFFPKQEFILADSVTTGVEWRRGD